jgi:type I restriction enzyme M protein
VADTFASIADIARQSPNFGRLDLIEPRLAVYGFQAETLVYDHPNLSLTQSGKFGETLIEDLIERLDFRVEGDRQVDRIRALADAGVLVAEIASDFDFLRTERNEVVHEHVFEVARALRAIQVCYKLGLWYHDGVTNKQTIEPFTPPMAPVSDDLKSLVNEIANRHRAGEWVDRLPGSSPQEQQRILRSLEDLEARVDNLSDRHALVYNEPRTLLPEKNSVNREAIRSRLDRKRPRGGPEVNRNIEPFLTIAKLWDTRNALRDKGLSTAEYLEQLSYLLVLKMAHEQANADLNEVEARVVVPSGYDWNSLYAKRGTALRDHYEVVLAKLGNQSGTTIGTIFAQAQNKITDPNLLQELIVDLIGKEDWTVPGVDLVRAAFEALLAKAVEDTKTGAGQYFTPRPLIDAMVDVMQPAPEDTIMDPACGTGGFLIAAHAYIRKHHQNLPPAQRLSLGAGRIWGTELVPGAARLAAMNMLIHGIGNSDGPSLIDVADALAAKPSKHASLVLANPPFGKKSSITAIGTDGKTEIQDVSYEREGFGVTTTNKPLNFLQCIMTSLSMGGRAAVVLPDNVLFEGGAAEKIRARLLKEFNLHTILRLPTGIFYAGGVKANVLFFEKLPPQQGDKPNTSKLWIYDFRTSQRFTLKQRPLHRSDL